MKIKHIAFNDDILTLNRERIVEICKKIIRRNFKFTWEGLTRADLVDEGMLRLMNKAGFVRISLGIETGSSEILKILKKEENHEDIKRALKIASKVGIVTRGSVIIGLPYETKETVKQTFEFINNLKYLDQVIIDICTPYPGTKLREMALKGEGGIKMLDWDMSNLRRHGNAVLAVNDLTKKDLIKLQKKGLLFFYFSPKKFIRNLSISHWSSFLTEGLAFIRSILFKY